MNQMKFETKCYHNIPALNCSSKFDRNLGKERKGTLFKCLVVLALELY